MAKLRTRMASGELEDEVAAEIKKCAGKAIYARRLGMAMITMCASQYPTVVSNEALEKIANCEGDRGGDRDLERVGGILHLIGTVTTEKLREAWKTTMDRRVGADLSACDTWLTTETKIAEAGRREVQQRLEAAALETAREMRATAMAKAVRDEAMEKERGEKEIERRRPSLNVVLHQENERGFTAVRDLGVLCGMDAIESPEASSEQ